MSVKTNREVTCPKCGKEQSVLVWSTVNSEDEQGVELVKTMRLNVMRCTQCDMEVFLDTSVLYHAMKEQYLVQYVCKEDMASPMYYGRLTKEGTPILDPISMGLLEKTGGHHFLHPHYVFSTREMAAYIVFRELCQAWGTEVPG